MIQYYKPYAKLRADLHDEAMEEADRVLSDTNMRRLEAHWKRTSNPRGR